MNTKEKSCASGESQRTRQRSERCILGLSHFWRLCSRSASQAQRTGRERDAASSGAGSAGGCTLQGPQLVPRFVSRVLRRWPTARRVRVGDRADSKQRKKTRAARCLLAAAEACTRRRGHYGGFFAAVTACAGAACLAASTTSEKLAAAASSSVALRVLNRHRPETRKLDGWKVSIQAKNECKNKDKSMRNAR